MAIFGINSTAKLLVGFAIIVSVLSSPTPFLDGVSLEGTEDEPIISATKEPLPHSESSEAGVSGEANGTSTEVGSSSSSSSNATAAVHETSSTVLASDGVRSDLDNASAVRDTDDDGVVEHLNAPKPEVRSHPLPDSPEGLDDLDSSTSLQHRPNEANVTTHGVAEIKPNETSAVSDTSDGIGVESESEERGPRPGTSSLNEKPESELDDGERKAVIPKEETPSTTTGKLAEEELPVPGILPLSESEDDRDIRPISSDHPHSNLSPGNKFDKKKEGDDDEEMNSDDGKHVLNLHPAVSGQKIIKFHSGSEDTWMPYAKSMARFLKSYEKDAQERNVHCDFEKVLREDQACRFDLVYLGPSCTKQNHFGYSIGKPCVLISPANIPNWVPVAYDNDTTNVPDEVQRLMRIFNANFMFVTCEGESESDHANIGPMAYLPPYQGFPSYFFPNKESTVSNYVAPLMAVEFLNPANGTQINVSCRAWAKNVDDLAPMREAKIRFSLQVN